MWHSPEYQRAIIAAFIACAATLILPASVLPMMDCYWRFAMLRVCALLPRKESLAAGT